MPDKITYQDFAKRIKEKYPQYIDLDDSTLTSKIIAKYPQYKETVDFEIPENEGKEYVEDITERQNVMLGELDKRQFKSYFPESDYMGLFNKKEEFKLANNKDISMSFANQVGLAASQAERPPEFLFDANSLKKRLEAIPKYFPQLTDQSDELKKQLLNINSQNIDDLKQSVTDLEKQVYHPATELATEFQDPLLKQSYSKEESEKYQEEIKAFRKYENEVLKDKHILAGQRLMEDTERLKELAEIPLTREQEGFWDKTKAAIKGLDVGKSRGVKEYITEYNKLLDDFKAYPEINRIYEKIKKLNNNEDVDFTTDERLLMQLAIDNAQVHEKLDDKISTYYKIGEGLGKSIGFQLEFLLTSSVGGKPAAAITKLIKPGMKAVPKYSLLALSKLTQAGIQTTTMPSFYKLAAQNASHGMSYGEAVLNAYWEMGAETLSERIFMKPAGSIASLNSFNKFLARTGINIRTDKGALGVILPMIEETGEEKISEILTAPKNYKDFGEFWKGFWDAEDNAVMLGSVSLMVGGMGSASVLGNSYIEAKRKGRLARYEKFVPTDLRAEIDAVLEIEDLSVKDQYDLIADAISDRIESGDLGEDPATTAGNAMAYMNYRIQDMAAETVNKKGQVEGNRLVVGKTEEGDTEAQHAQLDYLKQRGVEVPEGTKMDELGKLYDAEVAKETAETEIDEAETPEQIEEIKGKIEEDVDLLKKLDAKKEFITEKEKLDESLDKEEISETEYENKLEEITNTYEGEVAEKIEPVKPEVVESDFDKEGDLTDSGFEKATTILTSTIDEVSDKYELPKEVVKKNYNISEKGEYVSMVTPILNLGRVINEREFRKIVKDIAIALNKDGDLDKINRTVNSVFDDWLSSIENGTTFEAPLEMKKIFQALIEINKLYQDRISKELNIPQKETTVKSETEKKLAEKKTEISEIQPTETEQVEEKLQKKETVKKKVEEKLSEINVKKRLNELLKRKYKDKDFSKRLNESFFTDEVRKNIEGLLRSEDVEEGKRLAELAHSYNLGEKPQQLKQTDKEEKLPENVLEDEYGEDVYWHGSDKNIKGSPKINKVETQIKTRIGSIPFKDLWDAFYVTADKSWAEFFSPKRKKIYGVRLKKNAKILDLSDVAVESTHLKNKSVFGVKNIKKEFPFQKDFEQYGFDWLNKQREKNGAKPLTKEQYIEKGYNKAFNPTTEDWWLEGFGQKAIVDYLKENGYDAIKFGREIAILNPMVSKFVEDETSKQKILISETVTPKYEKLTANLGIKGKTLTKSLGKSARNGKIGGVSVILQQGAKENEVILESIKTLKYQRGTGKATNAMNKIIAEADKQGLTIKLRAVPEKGADISQENLIKFYENFGFEFKEGSIEGVRKPSDEFKVVENSDRIKITSTKGEVLAKKMDDGRLEIFIIERGGAKGVPDKYEKAPKGYGLILYKRLIEEARKRGYDKIYSSPGLITRGAVTIYERLEKEGYKITRHPRLKSNNDASWVEPPKRADKNEYVNNVDYDKTPFIIDISKESKKKGVQDAEKIRTGFETPSRKEELEPREGGRIRLRDTEKDRLETEKGKKEEVEQFTPKNNVEKTIEDRNKLLTLQSENKRRNIKSRQQRPDDRGTGIKVSVPRKSRVVVKGSNRVVRGTPVKKYSVSNAIAAALEYALPKSSVDKLFVETKDAQLFHDRITKSKEGNKFSASVFVYPVEDYKKYRLFMTLDGNAGVAIDDKGTIISVFSFGTGKGRAAQMVINAIIEGGTHLDHFNTGLTKYYYGFGFIPVARVKFNEEFAPDDWNYETYKQWNNGRPDVVLMVYMGGNTNTLHERLGSFGEYEIALENAPYYKSFDEAQAAQAKYVEQFKKQPEVTPTEEKKKTPKQREEDAKAKIAEGFSNLAETIGAKKSLTGEERETAIQAIQRIIEGLIELGIAKGMSLKDAVRDYLKQRNYIVDEDLLDEAIRRRKKPEDDFPIGTTNAKVRTSREMRGLEAIPKEERIGNEELWGKVVDKIDNGEIFPRQVVKEIVISDDVETSAMKEAIVKHDRWRILKETKYTNEEIIKKQNSQNKKGLIELFQRRVELENEMQENDLAAEKLGATWGRAGQFRQRNVEEDLSFEAIKREAKILNGGIELTIKQEQKFKELSEKYKELQKEYDKIREKERIREQQFQAGEEKKRKEAEQKLVNDIRNKVTPKSAKDFDTQFKSDFKRQKLSQKESDIKERLKERLSRLANVKFAVGEEGSSLIVEEISGVIQDMSELGIIKLEQGIDKIISKVKDYLLSINKNFDVKNLDKYKDEIKNKLGIPEIENAEYDELINKLVDKSQLGFDISVKGILKKILYNRVVAGSETIDDVVDDIYESVKDRIPNIDKRMIRDALSGYGEFRRLSKEEIDVKIRELKRQGRLDSAIEDVEDNRLPLRSGVERDKTTQETREKQARIIKEIKDRDLVPPPTQQDQETQWRNGLQAYQRRLENAIEDVKKEIDTGERKQRSKFKKYDTPELESLREELSRLREIRTAIDKETGRYAEQRESAIIKATERVIAEIEMDIDKLRRGVPIDKNVIAKRQGLFGLSKPMQEKFTSERIEELGKLKDALQQQLSELLPDAIKDKALLDKYKKQRQRRLEQLIEQQRTKDYGVKPKPYRPALDKEAIMINRDIEKLKYAIEKEKEQIRYKNMNLAERIGEGFINAWNIPKALMASIDLSAPMRQGIVMISKPKIFMKAFNGMFKYAFSEKIYEDWLFTLKTTDDYYEMIANDLYIAEPTAKLAAKEEDFMSNWLKYIDKIPLYGAVRVASERAYVGFLNKLRVDTYLNFKDKLQKQGFEAEELQNELKSYSHFINTATGRGKLKMTIGNKEVFNLEPIAALLNSAFFSPRLIASRLAMFNPAYYASMSKEARKDAIKTYFGTVGIIMGTLALSAIAFSGDDKFEIELDPRSSDFLKIRYGKIRFDLWGGHQQVARTLAQIITGKIKTGGEVKAMTGDKWYGQTRLKTLMRFFENKLSPSTALAKDLLQGGKNYEGEDITITNELINKTVPLYLKDVKEAVEEEGWEFAFIAGFPALFGVGVQTYGGKEVDVNETEETEETERVIRGGY